MNVLVKIRGLRRSILGTIRRKRLEFLRPKLVIDPEGFFCGFGCYVQTKRHVNIGKRFFMSNHCHLAAHTEIGDDVMFASYVSLVGGDHKIDNIDVPIKDSGTDEWKTITIENNVWVGHGAIILHGVTIKTGAVVAAGAVVTKDVESNAVVGGNPAKLIRYRQGVGQPATPTNEKD